MDGQGAADHRTIIAVDVEGFGRQLRTQANQRAIRDGLYIAMREAFGEAGIRWDDLYHEDRGDGILILVPPEVRKSVFVGPLLPALVGALRRHNDAHRRPDRIRLRMALHAGEVRHDQHGVTGVSIVRAFRLLECDEVKRALADSSGLLAVIASSWFFEEVIQDDPANAAEYRPVAVTVKETTTTGYICLPDDAAGAWHDTRIMEPGTQPPLPRGRERRPGLVMAWIALAGTILALTAALAVRLILPGGGNPSGNAGTNPGGGIPLRPKSATPSPHPTGPPGAAEATIPAGPKGSPFVTVAFDADGTLLAIGNGDGSTSLWQVSASGKPMGPASRPFVDPGGQGISSMDISPNGALLATGDSDGTAYLWTVRTHTYVSLRDTDGGSVGSSVDSVAFSPDGAYLAVGDSNGYVYLWSVASPHNPFYLSDPDGSNVSSVAFSANGNYLAAGYEDGDTYLFAISGGRGTSSGNFDNPGSQGVTSVAFSQNGEWLAAGDADGAVYLWLVASGNHRDLLDPNGTGVDGVVFSSDGRYLFAADKNGATFIWMVADYYRQKLTPPRHLYGPNGNEPLSIAYRRNGTLLAVGDAVGSTELWSTNWLGS